MSDFSLVLQTQTQRELAASYCLKSPEGVVVEWTQSNRSLAQNAAIHGLCAQILKQRAFHNGVKMTVPLYKVVFMDALGDEIRMMPKLDGNGFFPVGLQTSKLSKKRFSDLLEIIFAWCSREGLTVKHFDAEDIYPPTKISLASPHKPP